MQQASPPVKKATLVIGASSGIAKAIIQRILSDENDIVYAVSRQTSEVKGFLPIGNSKLIKFPSDYSEQNIAEFCQRLKEERVWLSRIFICNGLLHNERLKPERKLSEFSSENWLESIQANALVPMLWVQNLSRMLPVKNACAVIIFSARVGSVSDNRLGGWYSYRSAKAALNMLIKSASIELQRTHPKIRFILFHPGTTDTPLSKPFQQRVSKEKLFSTEFVADRLLELVEAGSATEPLSFIDWAGRPIEY